MNGCILWLAVLSISIRTGFCWFTFGPDPGPDDPAFTDCGGHLTDPFGTITSPNFADNVSYPNNANCTWKITVEEGHVIYLVFNFMKIEYHSSCVYDHLRVIELGYTDDLYCVDGGDLPSDVTSYTNKLILMFVTDSSGNKLGFNVTYTSVEFKGPKLCGIYEGQPVGTFGITDDQETNCTWKIQGATGERVQLYFMTLNIPADDACAQEYIEVIDNAVATYKFCGTSPPELFSSVSESVTVNFVTQKPSTGKGFEALFLVADKNRTCGGVLFDPVGKIESQDNDGDGLYDDYAICGWVIVAPVDRFIKINFTNVDIEPSPPKCSYDRVQVYDGNPDTLLDTICGEYAPVLVSSTNIMMVSFSSDSYINHKGFVAEYSHVSADDIAGPTTKAPIDSTSPVPEEFTTAEIQPGTTEPPVVCGSNLTDTTGEVMSPGYSSDTNYPSNADCIWYIIAGEGKTVNLTFTDMNIESLPGSNCYFDYLEVKEPSGLLHGTFCGTTIPSPITSTSNVLILYFISNSQFNYKGFHAIYTGDDNGGLPVCQLLGNTEVIGKLGSYDLGTAASNGLGCSWIIAAPTPDKIVQLYFTRLRIILSESGDNRLRRSSSETGENDLNCELNYIEVVDDIESVGKFCGNDRPPLITSSSNKLYVNVVIQNAVVDFEAHFSILDEGLNCGEIITARSGTITQVTSGTYENDLSCYWSIIALDGRNIQLDFTSVAIESEQIGFWTICVDYVSVYDGSISSATKLGEVCGISYKDEYPSFTSETNVLYLYFYSDGQLAFQGFVADYTVYLTESTTPPSTPPVTPTLPWSTSTAASSSLIEDITSEAATESDELTSTIELEGTSTASEEIKTTIKYEDNTVSTKIKTDVTPAREGVTEMTDTTVKARSTEVNTGLTSITDFSPTLVSGDGNTGTEVIPRSTEAETGVTGNTDTTAGWFTTGATDVVTVITGTVTYTDISTGNTRNVTGITEDVTDVTTGAREIGVTVDGKMTTNNETVKTGTSSVGTIDVEVSKDKQSIITTVSSKQRDKTTELSTTKTSQQPGTKTKPRQEQSTVTVETYISSTEPNTANTYKKLSFLSLITSLISSLVCLIIHRT